MAFDTAMQLFLDEKQFRWYLAR